MQSNIILHEKICLYCGKPLKKVKRGEHVVPKALGGTITIRNVCQNCNDNLLSPLDTELTSESPLKILVWDELGGASEYCWDYQQRFDLALEARPGKQVGTKYIHVVPWPQLILHEKEPVFVADCDEVMNFGHEYFERFMAYLRRARASLDPSGKSRSWHWQHVPVAPSLGRYPPRVFTRHTFRDLDERSAFICRYTGDVDRGWILWKLDNWRHSKRALKTGQSWGVTNPQFFCSYRLQYVLRALAKIGVNLLALYCKRTPVDCFTFRQAVDFILHGKAFGKGQLGGFIYNEDIMALGCPKGSHLFRLSHLPNGLWRLYCAFFGGRFGATVAFPGPNNEDWVMADIRTPLKSSDWEFTGHGVIAMPRMRVTLTDLANVMPSIPATNFQHEWRPMKQMEKE